MDRFTYERSTRAPVVVGVSSTVTLIEDRAPITLPLMLQELVLHAPDPVAEEQVEFTFLINGVIVAFFESRPAWTRGERIPINILVCPGCTWTLQAINNSATIIFNINAIVRGGIGNP